MIRKIAEELQFPAEALESLSADFEKLLSLPAGKERLDAAVENLYHGEERDYLQWIREMAEESGVHPYAADMAFSLYSALPLRDLYRERGYSDALFLDTVSDFRYKLMECKEVKGVWGTFVAWWWPRIYRLELFAHGRLQYEHIPFRCERYGALKKGDLVYNCHIPSSGPLRYEDVLDSLKKAHAFYHDELKDGILPVVCSSWLLYPPMYEVYPENSNLRKFYELFDIIETKETDVYHNLWRVFGVEKAPLGELPENTTLQRRLKQYLLAGGTMGSGYGVLLFDGEKILKIS